MNLLHKGYYLIQTQGSKVTSWDGSHSYKKGVTQAMELYRRLNLKKEDAEYFMVKIKKDIPYTGNYQEAWQKVYDEKEITFDPVPKGKVKLNEEAIRYNLIAQSYASEGK